MKRIVLLVTGIAALVGAYFLMTHLLKEKGTSLTTEFIEFAIEDSKTVDKFTISDDYGNTITLVKGDKEWTDDKGNCVTQESVNYILEAFEKIELKGYLPENSVKNYYNQMTAKHIKVDIYQDGEWTKSWYIGPSWSDHYGQVMLLETADYGKSDKPVIMRVRGTNGIIEPIFYADYRKWMCTNIFKYALSDISSVEVKYFQEPSRSFKVVNGKDQLKVYQQNKLLNSASNTMALRYLQNYKKIHFEMPNFSLTKKQVDSLKRTTPFASITVSETSGNKKKLRLFRVQSSFENQNEFGQTVNYDMDRMWCELPNGEIVKCQYFVMNPLLLGHIYFEMDLSAIKGAIENVEKPENYAHD